MNDFNKKTSVIELIYKKYRIKRYFYLIAGLLLFSVAFNLFWVPNDFVFGGVTGLSIIVIKLFNIDASIFIFIVSIVLLILSYILLGKEKTSGSILGSLLLPVFTKFTSFVLPTIETPTFISMIFGSVVAGVGIGIAFKGGFTTGGTDIINQIISKYLKISIGKAMIIDDGLIVLFGAYIFGFEKCLYSIVGLYLMSYCIDKVLLGISKSKVLYIITSKEKMVKQFIINNLNHTVTVFNSFGGKDKKERVVLFSVIPTTQYLILKKKINELDRSAFISASDAYYVYGDSGYEKI